MSEQMTTANRIAEMILRSIEQSIFNFDTGYDADPIANEIAAEIDALAAQLAETREQHKHCGLFLDSANAELRECQSALRLALAGTEQKYFAIPARIDDVRAALADAQAQIDQLTPYALAQIARLRYASISDELEDAEDELERRAVGKELADWDQTTIRAIALMEARWERDRKTMVRVELGDMVKAACS